MPIAACAKRLRVPLKNIWSRAPPVSNAAKTVDDHCRRMMLQERGKKAPPEPAAGDIDPLRILVDVPPRLTPLSAAPQIDEVRDVVRTFDLNQELFLVRRRTIRKRVRHSQQRRAGPCLGPAQRLRGTENGGRIQTAADGDGHRNRAPQTTSNRELEMVAERLGILVEGLQPHLSRDIEVPVSPRDDPIGAGDGEMCRQHAEDVLEAREPLRIFCRQSREKQIRDDIIIWSADDVRVRQERLDFRSEEEQVATRVVINRPDADGITREEQLPAMRIEESEREVSVQAFRKGVAERTIGSQHESRVGRINGNRRGRLQNGQQLPAVIEPAVEDEQDSRWIDERLAFLCRLRRDSREAARETNARLHLYSFGVTTSMPQRGRKAAHVGAVQRPGVTIPETENPAHFR